MSDAENVFPMMISVSLFVLKIFFEKYKVYLDDRSIESMEYKYIKHTLTAGISWNF